MPSILYLIRYTNILFALSFDKSGLEIHLATLTVVKVNARQIVSSETQAACIARDCLKSCFIQNSGH